MNKSTVFLYFTLVFLVYALSSVVSSSFTQGLSLRLRTIYFPDILLRVQYKPFIIFEKSQLFTSLFYYLFFTCGNICKNLYSKINSIVSLP